MDKNERIKKWNIFLAVVVIVLAVACILLVYSRQRDKAMANAEVMREQIQQNKVESERRRKDSSFYDEYKLKVFRNEKNRRDELKLLADGQYDCLYLTNTDAYFGEEWVEHYFAKSILVSKNKCETPERLAEYMEAALVGENLTDLYIEIDPYDMEQSYYAEHKYSSTKQTYMQVFMQSFWDYANEHSEVVFHVMIPIRSLDVWSNYSLEENTRRIEAWDQFIKFSSRYSNIHITSMATEEWLIANDELFDDAGYLKKEYFGKIFALQMVDQHYQIDYNDFSVLKENLSAVAINDNTESYYRPDFSDKHVVFLGDNVLARDDKEYLNVSGMFGALSDCNTYNIAIRTGTVTENGSGVSFCDMVDRLVNNTVAGLDSYESVADNIALFNANVDKNSDITIVILYGFNDYSNNYPLGEREGTDKETFYGALNVGISSLKKAYPNAHIVLATPVYTQVNDGGKGIAENGNSLTKYISALKKAASINNVCLCNLYADSGINEKNAADYLSDLIHPDAQGRYMLAKCLVRHFLAEMKTESVVE